MQYSNAGATDTRGDDSWRAYRAHQRKSVIVADIRQGTYGMKLNDMKWVNLWI